MMMTSEQIENWADELLMQYEEGRADLNHHKDRLHNQNLELIGDKNWREMDVETQDAIERNQSDKTQVNSMIRDMSESMEWLETGRDPESLRGIEKSSVYQRNAMADMDIFPSLDIFPEERELSESEKQRVIRVLAELSPRERQCFILHTVYSRSYAQISAELNVGKSTVQKYMERAKLKLRVVRLSYENEHISERVIL
ncbi:sigma-70 family RNA polymerase sigma factor [Oceanobacillus sp. FSL W7-1281]|uniref:sigma-70 family RNA polymerase sigma factor n=1 Tax=Oceanobacillus sp. FSL W7-1281 TaxID=2921698 RepID=UPI0030DC4B60